MTTETVDIRSLKPHPANARRGDVDAIADSLARFGQYRPIVVNRRTMHILAGNHTWQAARKLNWKHISVSWVDCDDETERKILIVDNRAADMATYDDALLLGILIDLGTDLEGTGFTQDDVDALAALIADPDAEEEDLTDNTSRPPSDDPPEEHGPVIVRIGDFMFEVEGDAFIAWADYVLDAAHGDKAKAVRLLRTRLNMIPPRRRSGPSTERISTETETVPVEVLKPFHRNPRQGDVGLISESLKQNGQYRPIVANRRTNEVLVGNHTLQAARAIGWDNVAVAWVDVDEKEALAIVVADNRLSDVSGYDNKALTDLVTSVASLDGTGFDGDDIDDLISGRGLGRPGPVNGKMKCKVGDWQWQVAATTWSEFTATLGDEPHRVIAARLNLPVGTWRVRDWSL